MGPGAGVASTSGPINIGIVTSVWGGYSRYLSEWVASVDAQAVRPALVTILDAGADDLVPARTALAATSLAWQIVQTPYRGMGNARNQAVETTPTEWVMHLDADDLLLPHALTDIAHLADVADVVSIGAIRGEQIQCFPHITADKILARAHGAFSCAAFRRTLWEQRPYLASNDWVDSPLWVGFAHLGARFVGTSRPGFIYRQHEDSVSHTRTEQQHQQAMDQWIRLCAKWDE